MAVLKNLQSSGSLLQVQFLPPLRSDQYEVRTKLLKKIAVIEVLQWNEGQFTAFITESKFKMAQIILEQIDASIAKVTSAVSNVKISASVNHLFILYTPRGTAKICPITAILLCLEAKKSKLIAFVGTSTRTKPLWHLKQAAS